MGNISSCRGRSRTREKLEETFAPTASQSKPTESQFAERITTLKVRRTTTKDGIKSMVNSPFTSDEDSNTFSHLIFEENELERQVREGLLKLNLSLKNNGEYFNVPMFLKKYANNSHGVKILLKYHASSISERSLSKLPEAAYLIEQVKFLEMIFIGHPIEKDEPRILLKESHGNIIKKKVRMSRYRKLIPRVKIIKKKDFVIIVGKLVRKIDAKSAFLLVLFTFISDYKKKTPTNYKTIKKYIK